MKKWILLSAMLGAMPFTMQAQDDVYFVPKKKTASEVESAYSNAYTHRRERAASYHSGSSRSVDEYNRRGGSYYEVLPGDSSDIINFDGQEGVYPDSLDEYRYTKRMARFDEYTPTDAYWEGYSEGQRDSWSLWHSPWYYSNYYPWYDSWYYDPWYYSRWGWSWHWGYYDPWYYGWYYPHYYSIWYSPYYYGGGGGYARHRSYPGTQHHGRISGSGAHGVTTSRGTSFSHGTFGSSRSLGSRSSIGSGSRSATLSRTTTPSSGNRSSYNGGGSTYTPSRSSSSSSSGGSFGGGGSFGSGGSRSSGGSFSGGGGSRSGGGSFGGGGSRSRR